MDKAYLQLLINELQAKGVVFEQGLSDDEILQVERTYEFKFPPDLRALLQFALPISKGFPNWRRGWAANQIVDWGNVRNGRPAVTGHELVPIREQLEWIVKGICFDIERNDFWMSEWGPKPEDIQSAVAVARKQLTQVPKLIPVYSHRFLPSEPCISGNPIFSVYQTDIIYYGFDLASYFANEFKVTSPEWAATEARQIGFWSALVG